MNFGALNLFDSFIKKLQKALDYINHVMYTYDTVQLRIMQCARLLSHYKLKLKYFIKVSPFVIIFIKQIVCYFKLQKPLHIDI